MGNFTVSEPLKIIPKRPPAPCGQGGVGISNQTKEEPHMVKTPWSEENVTKLIARQQNPTMHEYTCGGADCLGVLIPTTNGWKCPDCDYKQDWCHASDINECETILRKGGRQVTRKQVSDVDIDDALKDLAGHLSFRLNQKGKGSLASSHEILGLATEEHFELIEAVKSDNPRRVKEELLDLAVACVFGYACIDGSYTDW